MDMNIFLNKKTRNIFRPKRPDIRNPIWVINCFSDNFWESLGLIINFRLVITLPIIHPMKKHMLIQEIHPRFDFRKGRRWYSIITEAINKRV